MWGLGRGRGMGSWARHHAPAACIKLVASCSGVGGASLRAARRHAGLPCRRSDAERLSSSEASLGLGVRVRVRVRVRPGAGVGLDLEQWRLVAHDAQRRRRAVQVDEEPPRRRPREVRAGRGEPRAQRAQRVAWRQVVCVVARARRDTGLPVDHEQPARTQPRGGGVRHARGARAHRVRVRVGLLDAEPLQQRPHERAQLAAVRGQDDAQPRSLGLGLG